MESQQSESGNSSTAVQAGHTAAIFEPLLNDEQAARFLGDMHPKTLQRLARGGQIPAHKIGRYWFFRLSEIDA